MKGIKNKIYARVGIESDRTKNIAKHVFLSFVYKGGSILAGFLLVPVTMGYLNNENYGIWLTLSSFIAWFSFFDIGLGNGLRNKFAEAKANGDVEIAKAYVSTAYYSIGLLCFLLILFFVAGNFFINWSAVFNTSPESREELSALMPMVFGFFSLQLVLKLITTLYTADQHHSMQGKINFFTQMATLLVIWMMTKFLNSSLFYFGLAFSFIPVLVLILLNLFAFSGKYAVYKPKLSYWKVLHVKEIFGLGLSFFVIQFGWTVITTTDSFIISQVSSPEQVVPYSLAMKFFSICIMLFSIIVTPFWSSSTEAFVKGDFDWIIKSMRNLKRFVLLFVLMVILLLLCSEPIFSLWIGEETKIEFELCCYIAVYTCFILYLSPFNYFINGIGKIRLQMIQTIVMALLNIPIALLLADKCNLGVNGVIIATLICIVPSLIFSTIQYNKIIRKTATGIWNK